MTRDERIAKVRRAAEQLAQQLADAETAERLGLDSRFPSWEAIETTGSTIKRHGRILAGKSWGTAQPGTR